MHFDTMSMLVDAYVKQAKEKHKELWNLAPAAAL